MMTKIIAATLALGLMAATAMAQSKVVAEIPFAFYVGDTQLPAGSYVIKAVNASASRISGTSSESLSVAFIPNQIRNPSQQPAAKLVFNLYGSDYFLSEIWTGDGSTGMAVQKSKREVELAKTIGPVPVETARVFRR